MVWYRLVVESGKVRRGPEVSDTFLLRLTDDHLVSEMMFLVLVRLKLLLIFLDNVLVWVRFFDRLHPRQPRRQPLDSPKTARSGPIY